MRQLFLTAVVILLLQGIASAEAGNLGHRGGCKLGQKPRPAANSLKCLQFVKENLEHQHLHYLEFDVWEAQEGLVVMHGGNKFGRRGFIFVGEHSTVDYDSSANVISQCCKSMDKKTANIRDFKESQITQLFLDDKFEQHPPSLERYVTAILDLDIAQSDKIGFKVDVKELRSPNAVQQLFMHLSTLQESMSKKRVRVWTRKKERLKVSTDLICDLARQNGIEVTYGEQDKPFCKKRAG